LHDAQSLLSFSMRFVCRNLQTLIKTEEFAEMQTKNPDLALEILGRNFSPSSNVGTRSQQKGLFLLGYSEKDSDSFSTDDHESTDIDGDDWHDHDDYDDFYDHGPDHDEDYSDHY